MTDNQTENGLLEELKALQLHADVIKTRFSTCESQNREFANLFIKESPSEMMGKFINTINQAAQMLKKAEEAEKKFAWAKDYEDICNKRELLRSPGVHLTALLKSTGAKGTERISQRLLNGDVSAQITAYNRKVEQLSQLTADSETFRMTFALQKKATVWIDVNSVQEGSVIRFGTYPQTASGEDKTPIEWQVLAREGDKALVISKYCLDKKAYHDKFEDITWEKCTLRTWLNNDFINTAFSAAEQKAILTTTVDNSKSQGNSAWNTNGGNHTKDKVYLLSYREAKDYFSDDDARMCKPTTYVLAKGAYAYSGKGKFNDNCVWWLRSPGYNQSRVADVYTDGSRFHHDVNRDTNVVRPAFWLNLKSDIFES